MRTVHFRGQVIKSLNHQLKGIFVTLVEFCIWLWPLLSVHLLGMLRTISQIKLMCKIVLHSGVFLLN